jgi:small-conductance mechanosensitive channel
MGLLPRMRSNCPGLALWRWLLAAVLLPLAILSGAARAETPGRAAPVLNAADIDRLTSLLQDDARRAEFLRMLEALKAAETARAGTAGEGSLPEASPRTTAADDAEATPPAAAAAPAATAPAATAPAAVGAAALAPAAPSAPGEPIIEPNTTGALVLQWFAGLEHRLGPVSRELMTALRGMADLPGLWRGLQGLADNPVARTRAINAAWVLLLLTVAGLLAEHLLWRALGQARARIDALAPAEGKRGSLLWRFPLLAARLVLDLLPIAAFLGTVHLLLGLLTPLPTTRVIALHAAGVYAAARAIFALARLLLAPRAQRPRLIPVSDTAAARVLRWLRRLLWVGLGGYTLAEAGIALGLSWGAYDAILNITLLICSLQLVHLVIGARDAVAAVLRAPPLDPLAAPPDSARRMLRSLRNGFAGIWHVLTILWLLAAWSVWALAVEDGIRNLILSTLLALLTGVAAKGVDEALVLGFARFTATSGMPGVPRAATWMPVLRSIAGLAAILCGIFLIFWVWGLDSFAWFAPGTLGYRLVGTFASIGMTCIAAAVVWEVANAAIARRLTRITRESGQAAARSARIRTLLPMLRTVLSIVILVFLALSTLAELGVNVAPLLAGAGVVGLAVGFGSQTLVRDVITGIFLLLEDAVTVGDVVSLAGLTGVVEHLSIRSIKLRATDGSVHIIPFSSVSTVTNMTRDFAFAVLDVTVTYDTDPDEVAEMLRAIAEGMRTDAKFGPMIRDDIDVWGVDKMSDQGVTIRSRVKTGPAHRWPVQREFNRRIRNRCAELGIEMVKPGQRLFLERPEDPLLPPPMPSRPRGAA